MDEERIAQLSKEHKLLAVIEENVESGGCGQRVSECVSRKNLDIKVLSLSLPDQYIEHGSVDILRKETGIDAETLTKKIIETYGEI